MATNSLGEGTSPPQRLLASSRGGGGQSSKLLEAAAKSGKEGMRVDGRRTNLNLGISADVVGAELWCGAALEGESCQLLSRSHWACHGHYRDTREPFSFDRFHAAR